MELAITCVRLIVWRPPMLRLGFQNIASFNRRFRELKGMTPSEYRYDDHRFGRSQ